MLADGSILVNGGNNSERTSIYRQGSGLWTSGPNMNIPRGYPGNATLSDGSVLTLGGSWSGAAQDRAGEVWSASSGWTRRSGIPSEPFAGNDPGGVFRGDNHYWLFAMADGMVFHAGPAPAMHRIATTGNGSVSSAGTRADDAYSMNGNAILYDQGKLLKLGGAPAYEDAWATSAAYIVEFDASTQYARRAAPMQFARAFANSVLLPNGQVLVAGGQAYATPFSDDRSVLAAELWDPRTEVFTRLASMQVPRNYHAIALLLPDARVLVGGGGLCGDCSTNHANVEIITPPYLLRDDGSAAARPAILSATATAGFGGTVSVTTDSPAASFVMVRMASVTHSLNTDQRLLKLMAWSGDGRNYTLRMPAEAGQAIPGYYMLFALSPGGVPSVARSVALR
jgi:galactose oxidase